MSRSPFPFIRASVLFTLAIGAVGAQAAPGIVKNGSFESPALQVIGTYANYAPGESIGPWTVVGEGNVSVVSHYYNEPPFSFPAKSRLQWLDLTGAGSNSRSGVTQTVKTLKGRSYALRFAVGNVYDDRPVPVFGKTSTVDVLIDDVLVASAVNGQLHTSQLGWNTFSVVFTAKSSNTKITFMNADPSDDNNNGLDAVVLTRRTQ